MQKDLQRMELEARSAEPGRDGDGGAADNGRGHGREASLSTVLADKQAPPALPAKEPVPGAAGSAPPPPAAGGVAGQPTGGFKAFHDNTAYNNGPQKPQQNTTSSIPSFSPFPKVKGDKIPLSDDDKEEILASARNHVLHSNNVPMQLSWARDVLAWVEVQQEAYARESRGQPTRAQTPKTEHELRVDAMNIVQYLADQDHPEAVFMRSKWLEFGKFGFRVDKKEAYRGYQRAAEMKWGRAEYRMGMLYEQTNDFGQAVLHYNRGLEMGDSAASYRIGMMCLLGQHGHRKDYARGLDLIRQAADTSDEDAPQGAYVYGMLIARDLPDLTMPESLLPFDVDLARMYIEKAAYLGFHKAQLKMGQAYELCQLGCDFNPSLSLHYYGLAARQGQPDAALGVSRWFLFGYEGFFGKNEQLAFKYAQQAADAHLATGEFAVGYYYEIGIGVAKDLREARRWYELAAEHGNKDAVGRLESLDQSKTLTKADHETKTLARLKSTHGSQRGKRPDRLAARQAEQLPTLSEGTSSPPRVQSRPGSSGQQRPTPPVTVDFPDPSKPVGGAGAYAAGTNDGRPPAFTVNLDNAGPGAPGAIPPLAVRPKTAAPYPEDDRPPPLNLSRPKSAAPYPEDDMRPTLPSQQQRPYSVVGGGPQAGRPLSAFGIRPLTADPANGPYQASGGRGRQPSPGPGPQQPDVRPPQSANLGPPPQQPTGGRPLSAGWEPQIPAGAGGGYGQPGPGRPPAQQSPPFDQRLGSSPGPGPGGRGAQPAANKLTKPNPNPGLPPVQQGPPPAQFPMGGYGPRTSSRPQQPPDNHGYGAPPQQLQRPVSENYDRFNLPPGQRPLPSQMAAAGVRPERIDSLPPPQGHQRVPSGGGGVSPAGRPLKDRPGQLVETYAPHAGGPGPGRQSAPPQSYGPQQPSSYGPPHPATFGPQHDPRPGQGGRPASGGSGTPPNFSSPRPPPKQGPATFEAMGIPQGKSDDDCVSSFSSSLYIYSISFYYLFIYYIIWPAASLSFCDANMFM